MKRFPNTSRLPSGKWRWRKVLVLNNERISLSSPAMFESSEEAYLDLRTELEKIRTNGKVNISRPAPLFRDLA